MKLKHRMSLAAMFVLPLIILVAGCGSDSGTESTQATLSPEGVVMVNGQELTKTDLADELTLLQMITPQERTDSGFAAELAKPGTPEYAELEIGLASSLMWKEIHMQEAEEMGLTADEAEIKTQLDDAIKARGGEAALNQKLAENSKTLDWYKEQQKDAIAIRKVREAVTGAAPAGADETETTLNKNDAYWTWFADRRSQSDVLYGDQYQPATPFDRSAFLAKQLFSIRYEAWTDYYSQIQSITEELWQTSQNYDGVQSATEPTFQKLEKVQADMAAQTQDMTPEEKAIADQIVMATREFIDTYHKQLAAGEANDFSTWDSFNAQFSQINQRLTTLWSEWDAL